jgi:polyphosphate glucokinase
MAERTGARRTKRAQGVTDVDTGSTDEGTAPVEASRAEAGFEDGGFAEAIEAGETAEETQAAEAAAAVADADEAADAGLEAELEAEAAEDADEAAADALASAEVDADADDGVEPVVSETAVALPTGRLAIGVDVGGSGIKVAAVDLLTGQLVSERHRVLTPQPATPAAVVATITRLVKRVASEAKAGPDVPVGVGFPAIVVNGVTKSAANVDAGWLDFDADTALTRALKRPVHIVNDADAAGVAEMRFGAGVGEQGTVFLITLGTGTGSALFYDGMLVPNLELGHMEIRGRDAERRSAAAARVRRGISWKAWAMDLDEHLLAIEKLFTPRLFIIGGGVSKRADRYMPRLTVKARVVPAKLLNDAGIVVAAMAAAEKEAGA